MDPMFGVSLGVVNVTGGGMHEILVTVPCG